MTALVNVRHFLTITKEEAGARAIRQQLRMPLAGQPHSLKLQGGDATCVPIRGRRTRRTHAFISAIICFLFCYPRGCGSLRTANNTACTCPIHSYFQALTTEHMLWQLHLV